MIASRIEMSCSIYPQIETNKKSAEQLPKAGSKKQRKQLKTNKIRR